MILLLYGPPAHKWGQKQHQPTKHRVSSYLKWNRRKIDSNWIVHSRENALFFQTHVLLTEQDRGNGMKVIDLGLSSNWAPGRDGRLPSHLGASHLLTRPFSRGIDGGQGYRLRAQNDVKFKVKRLKQTSIKEKRDLDCKIWVNREPGAALTSERLSPRGGAKGLDTLGTRLDKQNGDQRERSSRLRKYF